MPNTKASIYLRDIEKEILINKKVIVRVDYNVPLDKKLAVTDDSRILATLETIKYLLSAGCKVILMSHLGRPNGESNNKLKLDPVARKLEDLLQKKVIKLDDCIGQDVKKFISDSNNGELILLENLRFYKEEEENDEYFAKELASLADIYINDAFGAAHRAHASTVGITSFVPSYIGFLMEKEIKTLDKLIKNPDRPFVSVIGGAKVRDKITILEKLVDISDILLIGGGMAYTFLAALGYEVGRSILEKEYIENVKKILGIAKKKNKEIVIPVDSLVADEFAEDAIAYNVPVDKIPPKMMGMDIGEKTIRIFQKKIENAKTLFWNGPLGVFEMRKFSKGTNKIAAKIATLEERCFTVIGGGDSIAAINKIGLAGNISHISTGGGASMEYLSGEKLPGIEAIKNK